MDPGWQSKHPRLGLLGPHVGPTLSQISIVAWECTVSFLVFCLRQQGRRTAIYVALALGIDLEYD